MVRLAHPTELAALIEGTQPPLDPIRRWPSDVDANDIAMPLQHNPKEISFV
jgi:hypothetical protein